MAMAKESGYYTTREFLERQYSPVISIPQYWEHYIDDCNKAYIISGKLSGGDRYVIQSKWKEIPAYGKKIWVVEQHGDIIDRNDFSSEIKRIVGKFVRKYGHTDKTSKKIYVKSFDRSKKLNSMMYNIFTGELLKKFVNPEYLNNKNEIKEKYNDFYVNLRLGWKDVFGNFGYNEVYVNGFKPSQICKIKNKFSDYCLKKYDNGFTIKGNSIMFTYCHVSLDDKWLKDGIGRLRNYVSNLTNMNDVYSFIWKVIK